MRILMPFWYLDLFDRYFQQMRSISENVDEFHVAYVDGKSEQAWKTYFSFHKVDMPYRFIRSKIARLVLSKRSLYNQVKDIDIDVIYTLSDFWAEEFSRYCSKKKDLPYVVRLRGNSRDVRKAMKISWYKKKLLDYLETRSLKNADLVIPLSRRLRRIAKEWGIEEEKIAKVVPVGVDTEVFRPIEFERLSNFTVGYAGRISPEKRVDRLAEIARKLPDVRFMIAGKRQMPISFPGNVEYLGELSFKEMPGFYSKLDLLVLPSITEGFPNAVLEAYACGKPVLVAKEAFPRELKIFGSVVDIENLESEIRSLKKSDLKAIGSQARSYVEKSYSWERFGRSILEHLTKVAKTHEKTKTAMQ